MQELASRYTRAKRALFDRAYGARLNPEQCRAVFTAAGPLLVLAGAGSGKTTVLVNRISYLIKYGNAYFSESVPEGITAEEVSALEEAISLPVDEINGILPQFITEPTPPWQVLAITFTNKAAREIRERLVATFEDEELANAVWSGTFHSVCLRILRKHGDRLGYRDGFSVYDTDDKKRLVTNCMKDLSIDEKRLQPKVVCNLISIAKDKLISPEDFENPDDPRNTDVRRIYTLYQKRLMEYNAVDFDDIIMRTVELLQENKDLLSYYQRKFRYVLVDEYQDTNYAQFVLTSLLSDGYRNIMVVGDDDQSIYKFRGATIENILQFDKHYADATVVKLEQNYRSTETILNAANAVISRNEDRHAKSLWCDKGAGEKITLAALPDQNDEGRYILDRIVNGVKSGGRKYSDHAVLYRINALGRTLQTAFAKSGVPYKIIGDMGFYDRKEVKDMLAYLTLTVSPSDNLRLKRIINEPKRKLGTATVDAIEQIAGELGISMYEVIGRVDEFVALAKSREKLLGFRNVIENVKSEATLPSDLIRLLFERTGYQAMLSAEGFEGEGKIENVQEFIGAAVEYEKRCEDNGSEPTVVGFLEEIALVADVDKYDESADAVVLMTVHAAKGLEFPVVFIAGMEEGIFPSGQNFGEESEISEERRLAYVAITRAKEKLYITHARNRLLYGKTTANPLSRFVKNEMPPRLIEPAVKRAEPPRAAYSRPAPERQYGQTQRREPLSREFSRTPDILPRSGSGAGQKKSGAAGYGIRKLEAGTRVMHSMFGAGVIVSARDMGGDVLYEVAFDNGQTKRLMATFANLVPLK